MEFAGSFVRDFQAKKTTCDLCNFYEMSSDFDHPLLCYIQGLFQEIGIAYSASNWRLFIDSSKRSLKDSCTDDS